MSSIVLLRLLLVTALLARGRFAEAALFGRKQGVPSQLADAALALSLRRANFVSGGR